MARARSLLFAAAVASLVLVGCKRDSWPAARTDLAARMTTIDEALPAPTTLPKCAAGADEGHLPVDETSVIEMAAGNDTFVHAGKSGVAPVCAAGSVDASDVGSATNQFNPESVRASAARKILNANGYAVIVTESQHAADAAGNGRVDGRIVLFSTTGKAECQIDWSAKNSDHTSVQMSEWEAKAGFNPTNEARRGAWEGDLKSNACTAILAAVPRGRKLTNRPNG